MRLLFETNVILDIWGETDDFYYSFIAYDIAQFNNFECLIASFYNHSE